ncbi:glycosyltransferase [Leptospira terpstrae]|uniref:glycosyltransferase n=1 Tax=Leptospira terpstrae TaxID=293075 RepID=UPI003D042999
MNQIEYPIITIVTPSYNQGNFILETLNSVVEQEGAFYIDYIVMDGCSSDNTAGILSEFEGKVNSFPVIHQISGKKFHLLGANKGVSFSWKSEKDKGQTDALNKAISLILDESHYFNWICSDDRYRTQNAIASLLLYAEEKSVVYGKSIYIDEFGNDLKEYPTVQVDKVNIFENFGIAQPSALICFTSKEDLFMNLKFSSIMDLFLWLKLFQSGYRFLYIDSVVISDYRIHTNSKTSSWRMRTYKEILALMLLNENQISRRLVRSMFHECIMGGMGKLGIFFRFFNNRFLNALFVRFLEVSFNRFRFNLSFLLSNPKSNRNP